MPIYEFVCRDCGSEFEQLMSFSAHGHPPCPACASQHVSRKIGRPAIHFKGSGWYVTDSKGSKQSANGDHEGKADGKSDGKADGKGADSKGEGGEKPADAKADSKAEGKAAPAPAAESKPSAAKTESSSPA
jgi:putative FmdB family regulatory protein